ncbi:oxygenase MpaB family protein [Gordonia paraffinivorans]|uniref:oxygenase MpaB family protein n=1 Tax=Gordonia paraffinivorans TaxID=175628 RepID=UPI00242D4B30|nr:oxygenase MpaB family protein [Gordonia paraffinivorans]
MSEARAVSPERAAAITGARNWQDVRAAHQDAVDALADGLMLGDRLADAVVAEMYSGGGWRWADITSAIDDPSRRDDAPPALRRFLGTVCSPPSWYDPAIARAGGEAWWRFGSLQSSTLYQSLIYGYQAPGFTRPLVATGRLTEGTWDRVVATARWVTLTTAPGLMEPGGPGWSETVRIRLVHALVRHHLHAHDRWDDEEWGVPINQTYSQLTITAGFLALPMRVAKDFGIRYSRADLEAITHLWRWVGWVMGVDEDRLPRGFDDARRTDRIAREFRMKPPQEARQLVKALLDDGYRTDLGLPGPLNDAVHLVTRPFLRTLFESVSRRWVDDEVAAAMGLRHTPLQHLVPLARPVIRSRELARWIGILGSDHSIAHRELRFVTSKLGLDLSRIESKRYDAADKGRLETVA